MRSLTHTQEESKKRLRAYIVIDGCIITYNTNKDRSKLDGIIIEISLRNVGQTPGHIIYGCINKRIINFNDPFPSSNVDATEGPEFFVPIGSGVPQTFGRNSITREDIINVYTKTKKCYFFFVVKYKTMLGSDIEIALAASELECRVDLDKFEADIAKDGLTWQDVSHWGVGRPITSMTVAGFGRYT